MLACVVGIWSVAPGPLSAEELAGTGVLVLRNGNVLRGDVLRTANHYRVKVPHGELRIRADQVEMFCHSLDEAYERRRSTRTGSTADSHAELAAWCLRHDLLEYAARELLEARAIDPYHQRTAQLDRQLQQALKLATNKANSVGKSAPSTATKGAPAELVDNVPASVPASVRATFVRQIQPLLVHSCATGGCHSSGATGGFSLDRLALDGAGHPDVTLRNLASTREQIDFRSPLQSPLLRRSAEQHGYQNGRPSQKLSPPQLQRLRAWVEQLALADRFADDSVADSNPTPARHGGVKQAGYVARDPFDPEAFNRQTAAEQSTAPRPAATPPEEE